MTTTRLNRHLLSGILVLALAGGVGLSLGGTSWLAPEGRYAHGTHFTTTAYRKAALGLLIQEADQVARQLRLPEELPLREADLATAFVAPFGFANDEGAIGNVTTRGYVYIVGRECKLSSLVIANWDQTCVGYRAQYQWPVERMDTNAAYALATQWLAAVSMDVAGLSRDCQVHAELDSYWNGAKCGGPFTKASFVPLYEVHWFHPERVNEFGRGGAASVGVFLPTKTLTHLRVTDPKYNLRWPLQFTNLDALLSDLPKLAYPLQNTNVTDIRTNNSEYLHLPPPGSN